MGLKQVKGVYSGVYLSQTMWNQAKKSMKKLKRPTSVFQQGDVGHVRSSLLKTWKTRETEALITQNFEQVGPIQGGTAFAFTDTSDFVLTEITRTPRTTTMPTSMPPRTHALPSHQSSFEDRRDFLNNCAFHDPEKFESFLSVTQENQNTCNVCSRPSGISTLP